MSRIELRPLRFKEGVGASRHNFYITNWFFGRYPQRKLWHGAWKVWEGWVLVDRRLLRVKWYENAELPRGCLLERSIEPREMDYRYILWVWNSFASIQAGCSQSDGPNCLSFSALNPVMISRFCFLKEHAQALAACESHVHAYVGPNLVLVLVLVLVLRQFMQELICTFDSFCQKHNFDSDE